MSTASLEDIVNKVPISSLDGIPLAPPPPGVKVDFKNPITYGPATITMGAAFLAIGLIFIILRFYTKARIVKKLGWDDRE